MSMYFAGSMYKNLSIFDFVFLVFFKLITECFAYSTNTSVSDYCQHNLVLCLRRLGGRLLSSQRRWRTRHENIFYCFKILIIFKISRFHALAKKEESSRYFVKETTHLFQSAGHIPSSWTGATEGKTGFPLPASSCVKALPGKAFHRVAPGIVFRSNQEKPFTGRSLGVRAGARGVPVTAGWSPRCTAGVCCDWPEVERCCSAPVWSPGSLAAPSGPAGKIRGKVKSQFWNNATLTATPQACRFRWIEALTPSSLNVLTVFFTK